MPTTSNLPTSSPTQDLPNLGEELVFPGGVCPSLPANRTAVLSEPPQDNDGWVLALTGNDDGSSSPLPLPFSFNLFGTIFNEVFINNNGNLSFGSSFSSFTSTGFPVDGLRMVAPFWADVDTRGDRGFVWVKFVASNVLAVAWDAVGYFEQRGDKRNTFMVMISDGNDASMGIGNNVCFCYGDMEWTTGDASGGVNGFGGTPATAGVNEGNGTGLFFQIGRYDGKYC